MVAGGSGCRGRGSTELFIGRRGARISEQKEDMDFSRLGASSSSKAGFQAAVGGRGNEAGSRGGCGVARKGQQGWRSVLTVLKCHFHPSTILNSKGKLHALLAYLYH